MMIKFIIYGLLGWNIEVLWTGWCELLSGNINMVGRTSLWMFIIYGSGGILFEKVLPKIKDRKWFERGFIWMCLIFAVEFLSGAFLKLLGITAWRYDSLFSVLGLIRLDYGPLWAVVGLAFERLSRFIAVGSTEKKATQ